jgi:hypothetical protein
MLRNLLLVASLTVIAWWVRDGDSRALRRELVAFAAGQTELDGREASDWGAG